jgi:hypothetical protein
VPLLRSTPVGNIENLVRVIPAKTLTASLASERLLYTLLLTGFQVKRMLLHFLDNVFGLNSPLEAAQGVFQGLSILETNFCQSNYTPSLGWFRCYGICQLSAIISVLGDLNNNFLPTDSRAHRKHVTANLQEQLQGSTWKKFLRFCWREGQEKGCIR